MILPAERNVRPQAVPAVGLTAGTRIQGHSVADSLFPAARCALAPAPLTSCLSSRRIDARHPTDIQQRLSLAQSRHHAERMLYEPVSPPSLARNSVPALPETLPFISCATERTFHTQRTISLRDE